MGSMETNRKMPTSPKASGQSRAALNNGAGGDWVSVYDAALRGVELMAGPLCHLEHHLSGLLWTKLATHGTLMKRSQRLAQRIPGVFCVAPSQVADGGLAAFANDCDLRLTQPISQKVCDE